MSKGYKFISLDRVISKLYRDLGIEDIDEGMVIEWCGEALEQIGSIGVYEEAVAFLEIKNYTAELPVGFHKIIQVAKNINWEKPKEKTCPANVIFDATIEEDNVGTLINQIKDKCIKDYVMTDCRGNLLEDFNVAYYRPYFDSLYFYVDWRKSEIYNRNYIPLRLSTNTFFDSQVAEDKNVEEYIITDGVIKTSFEEGQVAISYYRHKIDPTTGYPMIPDDISFIQAVTYYVTWKYMQRMWYLGREGYTEKMTYSEKQWVWYCNQAATKNILPSTIDEYENFTDTLKDFIPSRRKYTNFFGKKK